MTASTYGAEHLEEIYRSHHYAGVRAWAARLLRAKRARERRETRAYHHAPASELSPVAHRGRIRGGWNE